MDSGILVWVIPVAVLVGGAVGWFFKQYWQIRTVKRQSRLDAIQIIKDQKTQLAEEVSKTDDDKRKEQLRNKIDIKNEELRGLHNLVLRQTLKEGGIDPEEILIAEGRRQLQPQQVEKLKKETAEIKGLPPSDSIKELFMLANSYYYASQYEDALEIYTKILTLRPDMPEALNNRGLAQDKLERYDKALADFNKAINVKPDNSIALNNRGNTYSNLERYDEALADYNQALKLKPDYHEALSNRGATYEKLERNDEALADYNSSLEIEPDEPTTLMNRGCTYGDTGKYNEALADFNKALELKPDYTKALFNRGCTYNTMGKYNEALADFNKALELKPDYTNALFNRGATYMKIERNDKALADLNLLLEINPNDPDTLYNLSCLSSLLNKTDDALKYLEKAILKKSKYIEMAKTDKDFDNMKDDPRFRKLIGED